MYIESLFKSVNFKKGDVIKIKSIFTYIADYPIWHYGVVVGDNDVVHFNLNVAECNINIIRTSIQQFINLGSALQKCEMSSIHICYSPNEIAKRAISQVGSDFGGYNLFTNNCEHFANWCVSGERFSNQVPVDEGEHTISRKMAEKVIYEPVCKICDAGEEFCDKAERFTSNVCDGLSDFFTMLGL